MISSGTSAKADVLIPEHPSAGRTRYPSDITPVSAIPQIIPSVSTRNPLIFSGLFSGTLSSGILSDGRSSAGRPSAGISGAVPSSGRTGTAVSGRDISGTDGFCSSGIRASVRTSAVPASAVTSFSGSTGSSPGILSNTFPITEDRIPSAPGTAAGIISGSAVLSPDRALPAAPASGSAEYSPSITGNPAYPSFMPITASRSRMKTAAVRSSLRSPSADLHSS